jgi:Fic family protein
MLNSSYELPALPPPVDLETVRILKALNRASRALADLKGQAKTIPNQGILIDTLALQEAKASSEIENIVTTQDELFQADLFPDDPQSPAAKEVALYRDALRLGYARLLQTDGLIPNSALIDVYLRRPFSRRLSPCPWLGLPSPSSCPIALHRSWT